MKVKPSVKQICDKCKVIRRHGRVMVICDEPAPQAAPGLSDARPSAAQHSRRRRDAVNRQQYPTSAGPT